MILKLLLLIFFFISIYFISKKKRLLLDPYSSSSHKIFIQNKINTPLIGGLLIFFSLILFIDLDLNKFIFFLLILILGFFSDVNIIYKAKIRFFIQFIILLIFFNFSEIRIISTRIDFLDNLLLNNLFSVIFCTLCLMILINGFNFIDGLNGLALGYFLIVFINILYFSQISLYSSDFFNNYIFLITLLIILFLIFIGIFFLGDSGSYLLGALIGIQIININFLFPFVSPYYLILLIWYPCFEVLFSITRKLFNNTSPFEPDAQHLHQLIYSAVKKKIKFLNPNFFSSFLILFYNFLIIFSSKKYIYDSASSIFLILSSIVLYLLIYTVLKKTRTD